MNPIAPFVRHMLLCDDAEPNPNNPAKVNIYGLLSVVRAQGEPPGFPVRHSFTIYLVLTEGRGEGKIQVMVTMADSGQKVYESPHYSIKFGADPLKAKGVIIYVHTCSFPESGLYWVELWYNEVKIAQEALEVK